MSEGNKFKMSTIKLFVHFEILNPLYLDSGPP